MTELRKLLKSAGITQADLARALGLHPNTITAWHGQPPQYARAYLEVVADAAAYQRLKGVVLTALGTLDDVLR